MTTVNSELLPLLAHQDDEQILVSHKGNRLSAANFLRLVQNVRYVLPTNSRTAINFCADRTNFAIAFAAVCANGHSNVLPPSRANGQLRELVAQLPGCYIIVDRALIDPPCEVVDIRGVERIDEHGPVPAMPMVAADHVAAIAYTSGSTGQSRSYPKQWQTLVGVAQRMRKRFLNDWGQVNIVATVPPQHMYGLETTVMMAMQGQCTIDGGRPFYPADVVTALQKMSAPRVLITTPVHIRALLRAHPRLPVLAGIISATAPLTMDVARNAEVQFGCGVYEIYGCTEAGSMASRRTLTEKSWQLYDGMVLKAPTAHSTDWQVSGEHLAGDAVLTDALALAEDNRFCLLGRNDDMINVAGKRASLADLGHKLLAVTGVEDAVVFIPDGPDGQPAERPAALVVAPACQVMSIQAELAQKVDAVFIPRPMRKVAALPRNETGKLPKAALMQLLRHG